ncbi:hypothetical protein RN347_04325 [Halomonas sp. PAMB 3264]|uniref:hypothetical protein n=1 Tax=Halomonas sp. PAMB 3264 TaxID=3075222 RepID=UPI00289F85C7|nr:hypothetical protein [Halomonas sp. PAMB 3264]WNL43131.1 hypothetical protein RN347_04325 [Halomonas sp. PAMB 3264]
MPKLHTLPIDCEAKACAQLTLTSPARRALLKSLSLGAGGALLAGVPPTLVQAASTAPSLLKNGWLLRRADIDGASR